MVPGECFPTRIRATAHGVSAAFGKIGAIVAQVAFTLLSARGATPTSRVMQIFALFMFCGVFTSLLIPETTRKTLEELDSENPLYELRLTSFTTRFIELFWALTNYFDELFGLMYVGVMYVHEKAKKILMRCLTH